MIALFQKPYGETPFLLFEVGGSVPTEQRQRQAISDGLEQGTAATMMCEAGDERVGAALGFGGFARRQRHAMHLVPGVARAHCGCGIGGESLGAVEAPAVPRGIRRPELSVHTNNPRVIAFYKRCGFLHQGTEKGPLIVDGAEADEHLMAKRPAAPV